MIDSNSMKNFIICLINKKNEFIKNPTLLISFILSLQKVYSFWSSSEFEEIYNTILVKKKNIYKLFLIYMLKKNSIHIISVKYNNMSNQDIKNKLTVHIEENNIIDIDKDTSIIYGIIIFSKGYIYDYSAQYIINLLKNNFLKNDI